MKRGTDKEEDTIGRREEKEPRNEILFALNTQGISMGTTGYSHNFR